MSIFNECFLLKCEWKKEAGFFEKDINNKVILDRLQELKISPMK